MNSPTASQKDDRARRPPEYLVVGRVVRPHGVRGALVVDPESDLIASLRGGSKVFLGDREREYEILDIRPHRKRYLLTVAGVFDRDQAERFREHAVKISYVEREPLGEHEFYHWQIIGLDVVSDEDEHLGQVVSIIETGANDVYLIRSDAGDELLLPAIEDVILDVDLETSVLHVHLLPGLKG